MKIWLSLARKAEIKKKEEKEARKMKIVVAWEIERKQMHARV